MNSTPEVRGAKGSGLLDGGIASGLLQPLSSKSVVDRIIDRLTKAIIDRELQPGQKIPTEIELCESMQVGRNSVREAIKVLVTMGVLVIRRSEGTFVTEGFSERMLDPMVYGLILEGGDSNSMIELRQLFETGVFRYAIEKREQHDIDELSRAIDDMARVVKSHPDEHRILEEDMKFHRILGHMVKNPLVDKINVVIERLTMPSRALATKCFIERGELDGFLTKHKDMLRVIVERDFQAVDRIINDHFVYWRKTSEGSMPGKD